MSVTLEQYNQLVERVARLESLVGANWDTGFTPAKGSIAPPKPEAPLQKEEKFPGGGNTLMRVTPADHLRVTKNCIYFNTGKKEDSTVTYFAHSKNMKLVHAVYDPALEPGTLQANMYTRLNLELPLGDICDFLKMGEPAVCQEVHMRLSHMGLFNINNVSNIIVKNYFKGTYINNSKDIFVIDVDNNTYKAQIIDCSSPGIISESTGIIFE